MIKFSDKIFPNQLEQLRRYNGSMDDVARKVSVLGTRVRHDTNVFDVTYPDGMTAPEMASPPAMLSLLEFLIELTGATNILEIGSFVGLSAMHMARMVPDGWVVTVIWQLIT